jgi:hypothetical protein
VAQLLRNWSELTARLGDIQFAPAVVNGQPGAEYRDSAGNVFGVMSLDIAEGQIQTIRSIVNPEKLGHLGPVGDTKELVQRLRAAR